MTNETGQNHSFTATRTNLTEPAHDIKLHDDPSLVKVEVSYPAKHEGEKMYEDGTITWVSRDTADIMIAAGIGTEIKRSKDEKGAVESTDTVEADGAKVTSTKAVKVDESTASTVASKANKA